MEKEVLKAHMLEWVWGAVILRLEDNLEHFTLKGLAANVGQLHEFLWNHATGQCGLDVNNHSELEIEIVVLGERLFRNQLIEMWKNEGKQKS